LFFLEHSITLSICLNDSVFYKCICLGIIANSCLFSGHRVVNETLESISIDLGFSGNTIAEGLVVSTCLGGAFIGSLFSGLVADGVGRRRAFQLSALPMIVGASVR
jgi:MFS family permease